MHIDNDVAAALSKVRRRYALLKQTQSGILKRAEESFQIALAAYQEGATSLLRLLDAQQARNEIRLLRSQTEMEFELGLVELETSVGKENLSVGEELLREIPEA